MAKFTFLQSSFSSGELSPLLKGRIDLENNFKGLDEMTNFIPLKQGGAQLRPGTAYVGNLGDTTANDGSYAMIPFVISPTESYVVFINRRVNDLDGTGHQSVLVASQSSPGTPITILGHPRIWSTTTRSDTGTPITETTGERFGFQYAQSGDILVVVDTEGTRAPILIFKISTTSFGVEYFNVPASMRVADYPYMGPNTLSRLMRTPYEDANINGNVLFDISVAGVGTATLTAEDLATNPVNFFTGEWVGRCIQITHGSTTGMSWVTSKISDSQVNLRTDIAYGATTPSDNWRVSSWGGENGWPRSVAFHEGRLIFGGNKKFPDTVWGSEVGDIFHFMQDRLVQDATTDVSGLGYFGDVKDTDPFVFTISQKDSSRINWLMSAEELQIGTMSGEYAMTGGTDTILGINSVFVKNISNHGSCPVQPVRIAGSTIFVSRDRKTVREIPANYSDYGYSVDLSLMAEGILEKQYNFTNEDVGGSGDYPASYGICRMCYQESTSTLFLLTRDMNNETTNHSVYNPPCDVIGLTYERTTKILAWWKWRSYDFSQTVHSTAAPIYDIMVVPRSVGTGVSFNSTEDSIYMITGRIQTAQSIERSFPLFRGSRQSFISADYRDVSEAVPHMDHCFAYYNITPFSTVTPGSTWANKWFGVIANGNYIGTKQANGSGAIALGASYTSVLIGIPYRGELKTMPVEAGGNFGPSQGSSRRIHEAIIRLHNSRGGSYQANTGNEFDLIPSTLTSSTTLFSGERRVSLNASTDDTQVSIIQDEPYPMTVLWLALKGVTYDG